MSVTKEVDVDEELAEIYEESNKREKEERRITSATSPTRNLGKDPAFLRSLRAQGFEETESKSKLVYDFAGKSGQTQSPAGRTTILSSPTKTAAEPRPTSPFKPHPLQFVSPQVSKEVASAAKNTPPPPAPPPPKPASARSATASSPYRKPDPMQFVSPKRSVSSPKRVPASEPPNKPVRTWAAASTNADKEEEEEDTSRYRTAATVQVTSEFATPQQQVRLRHQQQQPPQSEPMTDTASRRSLAEKWSMFENRQQEAPAAPEVDPALMSVCERRALFERNRGAAPPKPVARFGDAVTPSMLTAAASAGPSAAGHPKRLFPARRMASPPKAHFAQPPAAALKRPAASSPDRDGARQPSPKRSGSAIAASPERRMRRERSASPKKMVLKDDWQQKERR